MKDLGNTVTDVVAVKTLKGIQCICGHIHDHLIPL